MTQIPTQLKISMKVSAFAVLAVLLPIKALGQEITLKTQDGTASVAGTLVEYKDGNYTLDSQYGRIRVSESGLICSGDACPVTWEVSLWGKRRAFTEHVEKLSELVSKKTDGMFSLKLFYGGLSDSRKNLEGIAAGSFEMAQFCAGYHREKNPSITVLELPFLGVETLEQEIEVSKAVYSHPATIKDMDRWNATLLMPSPLPQYNIMGMGPPPTSLDAFQGLNIRASGGIGDALGSLGANLMSLPAGEVRDAMDDGTLQAVSFAPHAHLSFNTIESGTWWTSNFNPGTVNCPVVVNSNALDDLNDTYRNALETSVDEALAHYVTHYQENTMQAWIPALDEQGVLILTLHDRIVDDIRKSVAGPAAEKWVAEQSANGLPAKKLYDLVLNKIAETK